MNLMKLLKALAQLMSLLLISASVLSCSTLRTVKPALVEYKGTRYWIITDNTVKGLSKEICVRENLQIINNIFNTNVVKDDVTIEECYEILKQGSVFYPIKDLNKLDVYIKTIGDQYESQ